MTRNLNEQNMYFLKNVYICILLLWNISFLVDQCEGQFQWGANYRLEALKLKEMLSRKNNGNGLKMGLIVRMYYKNISNIYTSTFMLIRSR